MVNFAIILSKFHFLLSFCCLKKPPSWHGGKLQSSLNVADSDTIQIFHFYAAMTLINFTKSCKDNQFRRICMDVATLLTKKICFFLLLTYAKAQVGFCSESLLSLYRMFFPREEACKYECLICCFSCHSDIPALASLMKKEFSYRFFHNFWRKLLFKSKNWPRKESKEQATINYFKY